VASSSSEVITADTGDASSAQATDASSAETTTKAAHVTAAKAAHMASTKAAAHVTAAKTTATAVAATATAAAGLSTGGNKAAGKQRTCQNHHQSSSHDISPFEWADIPPQDLQQMPVRPSETDADIAIVWRCEFSAAVSIKFSLNNRRIPTKSERARISDRASNGGKCGTLMPAFWLRVFGMLNSFLVEKAASLDDV
jgi:hypothetical protein